MSVPTVERKATDKTCWAKKQTGEDKKEDSTTGMFATIANVLTIKASNAEIIYIGRDNDWDLHDMFELITPTNHETGEEGKEKEELVEAFIGMANNNNTHQEESNSK